MRVGYWRRRADGIYGRVDFLIIVVKADIGNLGAK
jgi:hypothetical protein